MALTLGPWLKGFPPDALPCKPADIAARRWNLLAGDLPLPLAALDRDALAHNLQWMQAYARSQGVDLAPHGKTTMSPDCLRASWQPAPGASRSPTCSSCASASLRACVAR